MLSRTNKELGNSALAISIAYFASNGMTVSVPLNDTQDYDLVVEIDNVLSKIQVKGVRHKTKYGIFSVSLKSCGGTKGKIYKSVCNTDIHYLFVVSADQRMWLIPKKVIEKNVSTLSLGVRVAQFEVFM